jgi:hypothetical protein
MLFFDLPLFSTLSLTITTKIKHFCKQNHKKTLPKNGQKTCEKGLFLHIFKDLLHLSPSGACGHGVTQVAQHGLIQPG